MSLIEHMDREGWQEFLHNTFEYVLDVLKNDRHQSVGSAADDLRGWLARGGVGRVKEALTDQMNRQRYSSEKIETVNNYVDQLAIEYRQQLLDLTVNGEIPAAQQEWTAIEDLTVVNIGELLDRMLAGERPFEDWMYAHGHSVQDIAEVYQEIDRWLLEKGGAPMPLHN